FGENFSPTRLKSLAGTAMADEASAAEAEGVAEEFLAGQIGELENMINDNSPGLGKKKSKNAGGVNANVNAGEKAEDQAVAAYQRYAAVVNRNRETFTKDRHWEVWADVPDFIPEIKIALGIITLTIDLDFSVGGGIKNDGGTVYQANSAIENNGDIGKLGWDSIDVMSFGLEFEIGLYVNVELCLPIIGCNDWTLLDINFELP